MKLPLTSSDLFTQSELHLKWYGHHRALALHHSSRAQEVWREEEERIFHHRTARLWARMARESFALFLSSKAPERAFITHRSI